MKKILSLVMVLALFSLMGILATISTSCGPTGANDSQTKEKLIKLYLPGGAAIDHYSGQIEPVYSDNMNMLIGYKILKSEGGTVFITIGTVVLVE